MGSRFSGSLSEVALGVEDTGRASTTLPDLRRGHSNVFRKAESGLTNRGQASIILLERTIGCREHQPIRKRIQTIVHDRQGHPVYKPTE